MGAIVGRPSQRPRLGPLGLTRHQVIAVTESWKILEEDIATYSTMVFIRFFDRYPYYRHFFQSVTGVELSQVATDARTQSHFRVIFTAFGSLIQTLEKRPILLVGKFHYLALVHKDMDLAVKDFNRFRDVFIEFINGELKLDIFQESSWYAFMTAAFSQICMKMDEMRKEDQEAIQPEGENKEAVTLLDQKRRKLYNKYTSEHNIEYLAQRRRFWRTQIDTWANEKLNQSDSASANVDVTENEPVEHSTSSKVSDIPHENFLKVKNNPFGKKTGIHTDARRRRRATIRAEKGDIPNQPMKPSIMRTITSCGRK